MEEKEDFFKESGKAIEEYIEERMLLFKLQSIEKTSKLIAVLFTGLLLSILGFFILLFLSIMLGYFFASLTGSLYLGFGIVAAFYLILFLVILKIRKAVLEKYIINTVIETFFDKTADEDDNDNETKK
jgi:hypothetical protein